MPPVNGRLLAFDENDIVDIDLLGDVFNDKHEREGGFVLRRLENEGLTPPFVVGGADHLAVFPAFSAAEPGGVVVGCADVHGDGIAGGRLDGNVAQMAEPAVNVRSEACLVGETDGVSAMRHAVRDDFKRGIRVPFVPYPILRTDGGKRFKGRI